MKNGEHLSDKSHAHQAKHINQARHCRLHSSARPSHSACLVQPSQSPHRQTSSISNAHRRITAHFAQQTNTEHGHATHLRHPNRATNPNLHFISIVLPGSGMSGHVCQACQVSGCALCSSSASSLSCSYSHVLSCCDVNQNNIDLHT